jgi:hypothetical protein
MPISLAPSSRPSKTRCTSQHTETRQPRSSADVPTLAAPIWASQIGRTHPQALFARPTYRSQRTTCLNRASVSQSRCLCLPRLRRASGK